MMKILLLTYVCIGILEGAPKRRPSKVVYDTCTPHGGSCIKSNTLCDGFVDDFAFGCRDREICCHPPPKSIGVEPENPGTDACGLVTRISPTTSSPLSRIVGGDPAVEGEWPWQISLQNANCHFCGGTLITDQWILTAAHCLERFTIQEVQVILGEHHLMYNTGNEINAGIETWIMHPDYKPVHGLPNDIALIKLDRKVDITGHYVRTACLPEEGDGFTEVDSCYISGWGNTKNTGDYRYLQHMNIPIAPLDQCNSSWIGVILDSNICIGSGQEGACQGDSGGPLVCKRGDTYVLAGATSWGSASCQELGRPNIYTRVTSYMGWIKFYIYV